MKTQFIKIFTTMFALLIATSLVISSASVTAQTTITNDQEKAMNFMENMLPIDLSKYTITLKNEYTMDELALGNNRKINSLTYQLKSEKSIVEVNFLVEKNTISLCSIAPIEGEVIYSKQYRNPLDAVKAFLEKYQTYTKIDSGNLITMLNSVDTSTKNSTITTENSKLEIYTIHVSETDLTEFYWTYTIAGVDYTSLELGFDKDGNFMIMTDTRGVFTIGDTSINISQEQAIAIALEKLQSYSYELPDGSIVKDFHVTDVVAMLYTVPLEYVDYELRPYWDVKLFLDEVTSGSVFGITVFLWANTGEVISISNMASGGIDNTNDTSLTSPNHTLLFVVIAVVAVVIAALAVGLVVKRKRK
ncbi:MAG: hypothetical protein FWC30_00215 [Candidatus Bathyarchaeota archaeon]|nr:hypothetical protein [Candidatus Termiticorpusculum sp.]